MAAAGTAARGNAINPAQATDRNRMLLNPRMTIFRFIKELEQIPSPADEPGRGTD
jgi:hypothetical protein